MYATAVLLLHIDLFHHERQRQATNFPVPVSGWDGMGNGHHVNLVERNVAIHLLSIPSGSQSVGEDQRGATVVATKSLVIRHMEPPRVLPPLDKLLLQPKWNI